MLKQFKFNQFIVPATSKAQVARMFGVPVNGQNTTLITEETAPVSLVYGYDADAGVKFPIEKLAERVAIPSVPAETVTIHDGAINDVPVIKYGEKVPVKNGYFAIWDAEEVDVFDLYYLENGKVEAIEKYQIDADGDLQAYNWDKWL